MQGQKGNIGSLQETFALEHGSASSDSSEQICWNNYIPTQEHQNLSIWSMGESSSSSGPGQTRVDPKTEHGWASSMLSLGDVNMNITHNHNHNHGSLFMQNSRPESLTHNNVSINPSTFVNGSSSSNPFEIESRQLPCKRKASELIIGQSSNSNMFQRPENPLLGNELPSESIIPRLRLGIQESSSDTRNVENTPRNVRIRINSSRQPDPSPLPLPLPVANNNILDSYSSLRLNPVDLRAPPVAHSFGQESQPVLRRSLNLSSRWNRNSTSRTHRNSNNIASSDTLRPTPTNISDHPIFIQPREVRTAASQTAINFSLTSGSGGGGLSVAATSSHNVGSHRGSSHYPSRRLSEILRRSLLSSMDSGVGGGGQNGNLFARIPPPVGSSSALQEGGVPPVIGVRGDHPRQHLSHSRSSDRHLDAAFGFPYVARSLGGGSEGRGRLVSEIRNVLDLIRRGEGLRFEDVMLLDQSMFYGMADMHDRHRDMRLDIDNMSYEELLALEERIGNVNTGLTEDTISTCLKHKTYLTSQQDSEPCCICQEEYNNGDDLGSLKCGHDFHTNCIKQWLLQKNLCPVCKSAASK